MRLRLTICFVLLIVCVPLPFFAEGVIIDHRCTDLSRVPKAYIIKAKRQFKVTYGRTSHGSQLVAGMNALKEDNPDIYNFGKYAGRGSLSFWDGTPEGDLGRAGGDRWYVLTRNLLQNEGKDRSIVMWSWCGQVSSATSKGIDTYLRLMSRLESEFPGVIFIYMTGHLDGTGRGGNLNRFNERIRKYCRENEKVLFDFADIESFDPDGKVDYMALNADDRCRYDSDGDGRRESNWAEGWIAANPGHGIALPQRAAHTHPLNAALKGRAFWWMLACLAGWKPDVREEPPVTETPSVTEIPSVTETPATAKTLPMVRAGSLPPGPVNRLYDFKTGGDFSDWEISGVTETVSQEVGKGLVVPHGGRPGVALNRNRLSVRMLEFNARGETGSHVNWYVHVEWTGTYRPRVGIGGFINKNGCSLVINGRVIAVPDSPKIDRGTHRHKIVINDGKVFWGIDGRLVTERLIPRSLETGSGRVAVGGWKSRVIFTDIRILGTVPKK